MFDKAYFNNRNLNILFLMMGIVYVLFMIKLLFLRPHFGYSYNLVPMKTIKQYIIHREHFNFDTWVKNLFGNIVLFIPMGLFMPVLNQRLGKIFIFIGAAAAILFLVELVQLLTRVGSFDVDDIILNTLGAVIGFFFTRLVLNGR
ncbi:VanZ family protein [Paenibacillus sp. BR2-3]|uniref:VanZ family protein n=1 Tax=Paenibacillus sp. BR2-3 TaxID=3048494 RepID=UPI0039778763